MYAQINEHRNFLSNTDYKVIKEAETSYVLTEDEREQRQNARDEINRLTYKITLLEEELELVKAQADHEDN